jgi:hypothetical protein
MYQEGWKMAIEIVALLLKKGDVVVFFLGCLRNGNMD